MHGEVFAIAEASVLPIFGPALIAAISDRTDARPTYHPAHGTLASPRRPQGKIQLRCAWRQPCEPRHHRGLPHGGTIGRITGPGKGDRTRHGPRCDRHRLARSL